MRSFYDMMEMANRWIPHITDPETQLEFLFDCVGAAGEQLAMLLKMDENNDWVPTPRVRRWMEAWLGAVRDDYALRFKYCLWKGLPYVAAYYGGTHFVFRVRGTNKTGGI